MAETHRSQILIVGSGGNGISPAILLDEAGYSDFLIITKHDDFGGAWYQNGYPGCEVDIPSNIYQFNHAPSLEWTALFPAQPEVRDYMQKVARDGGLYSRTHFGTELIEARWLDEPGEWSVTTNRGEYRAQILILATGFLEEAVVPEIPGIESFRGKIFHSSEWPEGYLAEDERVAVVGSGSSAIQIVPELQKTARSVVQFVRTPAYMLPKNNRSMTAEENAEARSRLAEELVGWNTIHVAQGTMATEILSDLAGQAVDYLESKIEDPELRRILTPTHTFGCKRPLFSDTYFDSLTAPNAVVEGSGVAEIGPDFVVSETGKKFEVDAIVLATGFYFGGHILHQIRRRDGRTVGEYQAGHPRAYKSVSVSGAPNLFLAGGPAPNGQIWHGLHPGEAIAEYVVQALAILERTGARGLEVREEVEIDWKRKADEILDSGVKVSGGCANYSQDAQGHDKADWPGTLEEMTEALRDLDAEAYELVHAGSSVSV